MLFLGQTASAQTAAPCPTVKMQVERLPDLNIPRIGHSVVCVGNEVVVAGGHTSGFVPTATAEYYSDGKWHLVPTVYTHDQGMVAITQEGEVMLAGGFEKELGIGQTFTIELYDPATHTFRGYGCLDQKRCFAKTLPLDSGRIVISGNWYHDDCIEIYDGTRQCKYVKPVAQHRTLPHIIRTAKDNAIVFSAVDYHANAFDTIIIDRLKGAPFTVPLFEEWRPVCPLTSYHGACFIGDEAKGDYTSLIQVLRSDSLMAIAQVKGEDFSLLPTTCPIPMQSQWGRICWYAPILADRNRGRAYIVGYGEDVPAHAGDHRFYVAAIDYLHRPAPLTLYYSEPQDSVGRYQPVLTGDGDVMIVGGILHHHNNYDPVSTVLLLRVGGHQAPAASPRKAWMWWLLLSVGLIALVAGVSFLRRPKQKMAEEESEPDTDDLETDIEPDIEADDDTEATDDIPPLLEELMERICQYMEEQQPFLNSTLKLQDLADALDSNRSYISSCIRKQRGCSFSQFVNIYRVEYAMMGSYCSVYAP